LDKQKTRPKIDRGYLAPVLWLKAPGSNLRLLLELDRYRPALGPYMFSVSMDLAGSYDLVAWICLAISVLLVVLAFKADNLGLPGPN
jgi:hypothetical protein